MFRIFAAFLFCLTTISSAFADKPLTVFAASSLSEAMEKIGQAFEEETGTKVIFSFAGTGTLARQVEAGAPADIFVAADAEWMDYLVENGAVRPGTATMIASNALVLIGPKDTQSIELTSDALLAALDGARLAIADPDTVPAGRYGKAALEHLKLWSDVETRLAPMENVRVTLASVARGDTPIGLVYATDAAIEPKVAVVTEIPTGSHSRIEYPATITEVSSHPDAEAFLTYLTDPKAQNVLRSLGFVADKDK
ncbi:MAG: molybdate ABC transporter substrate-binding protein [Roseibium sp.]